MAPADIGNTPAYWIRPTQVLSAAPGFHRFVWDLHYSPAAGTSSEPGQYPISATPHDTPREPRGPWAIPGQHTARLTVDGKTYSATFTIKMDPRIKTPATAIAAEHAMAVKLFDDVAMDSAIVSEARGLRSAIQSARDRANNSSIQEAAATLDAKIAAVAGQGGGGGRRGGGGRGRGGAAPTGPTVASINGDLMSLMALLEDADAEPTKTAKAAVAATQKDFDGLVARWKAILTTDVAALNVKLKAAGQSAVVVP
jgi:hypothetical protein